MNHSTEFHLRPEIAVAKLRAAGADAGDDGPLQKQAAHPCFAQLILWLQAISQTPGGFPQLARDLVRQFPHCLGTPTMLALPHAADWSLEQKLAVLREIPRRGRPLELRDHEWRLPEPAELDQLDRLRQQAARVRELMGDVNCGAGLPSARCGSVPQSGEIAELDKILANFTPQTCQELCRQALLRELPLHLFRFCSEPPSPLRSPFYAPDLFHLLLDLMAAQSEDAGRRVPQTEISRQIQEAFAYAIAAGAIAKIETDGRWLEIQTVKDLITAHPGAMRLVETPSDNGDLAFQRVLAHALGLDPGFAHVTPEIRAKTAYIAQNARLLLVFANAQFLLPTSGAKDALPARLHYIDTQLLQHGVPVALVSTRDEWHNLAKRYRGKTSGDKSTVRPFDTWLARHALTYSLPAKLTRADTFALARSIVPEDELADAPLQEICAKASQTTLFLADVKKIIALARVHAQQDGRREISAADIDRALARIIPAPAQPSRQPESAPELAQEEADKTKKLIAALEEEVKSRTELADQLREQIHQAALDNQRHIQERTQRESLQHQTQDVENRTALEERLRNGTATADDLAIHSGYLAGRASPGPSVSDLETRVNFAERNLRSGMPGENLHALLERAVGIMEALHEQAAHGHRYGSLESRIDNLERGLQGVWRATNSGFQS